LALSSATDSSSGTSPEATDDIAIPMGVASPYPPIARVTRSGPSRRSEPIEAADMVVWLATEAPDYMTAARLNVTGGLDKD
jgi:NAD(P)-dependent dehydrogenase (short-subunit alcohol dehydrogenase family)